MALEKSSSSETLKDTEVKEIDWVMKQTKEALSKLKLSVDQNKVEIQTSFFEKVGNPKEQKDEYIVKLDVVKQFLEANKDKPWKTLSSESPGAFTTAIQLALKSLSYDTGKVDGLYGPKTKEAIKKFQSEHNLQVDGAAGKATIGSLLVSMNTQLPNNDFPFITLPAIPSWSPDTTTLPTKQQQNLYQVDIKKFQQQELDKLIAQQDNTKIE